MPTAPGYAEVSYQFTLTGYPRPAYVTFGVKPTDTAPGFVAEQCALAFGAAGSLLTVMSNAVQLTGTRVSVGQDGGEDLVGFSSNNIACTGTSTVTTPNVALLIHKRTSRGGRRGRGRVFLPWAVEETGVDAAGVITTVNLTARQTAANTWLGSLQTRGCPMFLLHGPGVFPPPPPDGVTGLDVDRIVGTQRRRLGR